MMCPRCGWDPRSTAVGAECTHPCHEVYRPESKENPVTTNIRRKPNPVPLQIMLTPDVLYAIAAGVSYTDSVYSKVKELACAWVEENPPPKPVTVTLSEEDYRLLRDLRMHVEGGGPHETVDLLERILNEYHEVTP